MTPKEEIRIRRDMAEAINSGITLKLVAESCGVTVGVVRKACDENGVLYVRKSSIHFKIVADLCNTDISSKEVAQGRGVTDIVIERIYREAKEAGVPVRIR